MCKRDSKLTAHLLLHCKFTKVLWNLAISGLGISWVASDSMKNDLLTWEGLFGRKVRKRKKASWVLPHVIFWEYLEGAK